MPWSFVAKVFIECIHLFYMPWRSLKYFLINSVIDMRHGWHDVTHCDVDWCRFHLPNSNSSNWYGTPSECHWQNTLATIISSDLDLIDILIYSICTKIPSGEEREGAGGSGRDRTDRESPIPRCPREAGQLRHSKGFPFRDVGPILTDTTDLTDLNARDQNASPHAHPARFPLHVGRSTMVQKILKNSAMYVHIYQTHMYNS
jgi:hypothetical protein